MRAKDRRDIELRRRKPSKAQRQTVLIACEGDKLEPGYLHGLRRALGLEKERVVILPSGNDTDPRNVVRMALKRHRDEGQSFDFIFCVVDQDDHPGLAEARELVASHKLGKAGILKLIVTVPCFEVWLLLHLTEYSTAAFQSSADAKAKMEKVMPGYSQMGITLYAAVQPGQAQAVGHAKRLENVHKENGSDGNPSSGMPEVLTVLEILANEAKWPKT